MARGRKADKGTYEARGYVLKGCLDRLLADDKGISNEGCVRLIKAVKFGLGIKEEAKEEKQEVVDDKKEGAVTPIKEKKVLKTSINKDGDEYFAPEDCKEVGY